MRGQEFSHQLAEYVEDIRKEHPNLLVWTSWMKRTIDTAQYIPLIQERYYFEQYVLLTNPFKKS